MYIFCIEQLKSVSHIDGVAKHFILTSWIAFHRKYVTEHNVCAVLFTTED